ncbi:hypothetical protein BD289DRAFT_456281 [Coniella lustricola]|uniref:Rhodopsin domain-containing protein n=1 Tax=Coniella lustricola TaxID=2025994 RepID=A0A2T2ZWC5_9PEZI|nr:hypothetical protein BD289DRAFT_456281 [Coniella lustricola]
MLSNVTGCLRKTLLTIAFAAGNTQLIRYGEGYDIWDIDILGFKEFLRWLYYSSVIYIPAAYTTKATILLLIARVFAVRERIAKALRYFIIALGIAYLPIQIAKTAICIPVSAYWTITSDTGLAGENPHCLNQSRLFTADIAVAVITDIIILILPMPLAISMRTLSLWQKIKIVFLLSTGGVAVGTTVYRLYYSLYFVSSTNPTKDFTIQSILTLLELAIGLICACLPSVNVLVKSLIARIGARRRHSAIFNVPRTASSGRGRLPLTRSDTSSTWLGAWRLSKPTTRTTTTAVSTKTAITTTTNTTTTTDATLVPVGSTSTVGGPGDDRSPLVSGHVHRGMSVSSPPAPPPCDLLGPLQEASGGGSGGAADRRSTLTAAAAAYVITRLPSVSEIGGFRSGRFENDLERDGDGVVLQMSKYRPRAGSQASALPLPPPSPPPQRRPSRASNYPL